MIAIKMTKETRLEIIRRIQAYYLDERGEQIGELGADSLMQFFAQELAPFYYNQALNDAQATLRERFLAIEEDLHVLEKPTVQKRQP